MSANESKANKQVDANPRPAVELTDAGNPFIVIPSDLRSQPPVGHLRTFCLENAIQLESFDNIGSGRNRPSICFT